MAKSKKSKSAAIRDELKKHGGSPKRVAEALRKQGIKVTAQYVSVIKASDKRKAAENAARASVADRGDLEATKALFDKAVNLISKAGGAEAAHKVIDSAATLMSHVR